MSAGYIDQNRESILSAASDEARADRNEKVALVANRIKLLVVQSAIFDNGSGGNPLWLPDRRLLDGNGQPTEDVLYGDIRPLEGGGTDRIELETMPRAEWWERISRVSIFLMNSESFDEEVAIFDLERVDASPGFSATSPVGLPMGIIDLESILADIERYGHAKAVEFPEQ